MRRPAAAVAAVVMTAAVIFAGPAARAHEDVGAHGFLGLAPDGDVESPPTLGGHFEVGVLEYVDTIQASLSPTGPTGGTTVSVNACTLATVGKCGESRVDFLWPLPPLAYNGPYVANATARHCLSVCVAAPTTARVKAVSFRLAAPPRKPESVKADVNDSGSISVSWARNPEPDMVGYAVFRKGPGATSFTQIGQPVPQPPGSAARVSFQDTSSAAGGTFSYQIVAVRHGASGDASTAVPSAISTTATALVPVATTTSSPAADGAVGGATTTTVKGKASGAAGLNLGGFVAKGSPPPPPMPIPTLPDVDNGFNSELPFGAVEPAPEDEAEPGGESALPLGSLGDGDSGSRGALIPVAVGSMLLVLAMHARFLSRRLAVPQPIAISDADAESIVMPVTALSASVVGERDGWRDDSFYRPDPEGHDGAQPAPERPFVAVPAPERPVGRRPAPAPPEPAVVQDSDGDSWADADWGGSELPAEPDAKAPPVPDGEDWVEDQVRDAGGIGGRSGGAPGSSPPIPSVLPPFSPSEAPPPEPAADNRATTERRRRRNGSVRRTPVSAADRPVAPEAAVSSWPRIGDTVPSWVGASGPDGWWDDEVGEQDGSSGPADVDEKPAAPGPDSEWEQEAVWEVVSPSR